MLQVTLKGGHIMSDARKLTALRLSADEKQKLEAVSKAAGQSQSEWMRQRIKAAYARLKP